MGEKIEREDNMRVRCKDNKGATYGLTEGRIYETLEDFGDECVWMINNNGSRDYYHKSRFEKVGEVMKIKDWKELDGKEINGYLLSYDDWSKYVYVKNNLGLSLTAMQTKHSSKEKILEILRLYGIEIEFEKEITITQTQFHYLKWIESFGSNVSIKLNKNNPPFVMWENGKFGQYQGDFKMFPQLATEVEYLVSDLLKIKVEG